MKSSLKLIFLCCVFNCGLSCGSQSNQNPGATQQMITMPPVMASPTIHPTLISSSPTPVFEIGSTLIGEDGMTLVYVPEGAFTMGGSGSITKPVHSVYVNAYWIDKTEVTNALYRECVVSEACSPPSENISFIREGCFSNSEFDDYPVTGVSWYQAKEYCEYVGRRLPTEAEWEKAARGTDERHYPWGMDFISSALNFCDENCSADWADKNSDDGYEYTSPVGSFPAGASPFGVLDMAGNVWEWVSSMYKPYPYDANDGREDQTVDGSRILRGGSWTNDYLNVRTVERYPIFPTATYNIFGFRCALSAD